MPKQPEHMQPSQNAIQRLPDAAVQLSRASTQITDFSAAIACLVHNCIDAGSQSVHVAVSTQEWTATVADDGHGIAPASMQLLGQHFCSSKPAPARGEALSCLSQVASVLITSRAQGMFETYKKALGTGINPSSGTSVQLCASRRQRHGTTVHLSNFLQNQPVRRRQLKGHAAALLDVKTALYALLLPHAHVELILQQAGSSTAVLHMPKGRTLAATCQQLFWQLQDNLHNINTPHSQGWQLDGCIAAPPATFASTDQQLLYINKHSITCNMLQQLLRDWYVRSLRCYQANSDNHSSRSSNLRAPEPGYVLLITCPTSVVILQGHGSAAGQAEVDCSLGMAQLLQLLDEALAPVWGSMPVAWRAAAAPAPKQGSTGAGSGPCSGGSGGRNSKPKATAEAAPGVCGPAGFGQQQSTTAREQRQVPRQVSMLPVHGLQLSSRTRSLAGSIAGAQATAAPGQPTNLDSAQQRSGDHSQSCQQQPLPELDEILQDEGGEEYLVNLCHSPSRQTAFAVDPSHRQTAVVAAAAGEDTAWWEDDTFDEAVHHGTSHMANGGWMKEQDVSPAKGIAAVAAAATPAFCGCSNTVAAVANEDGRDELETSWLQDGAAAAAAEPLDDGVSAATAATIVAAAAASGLHAQAAQAGRYQATLQGVAPFAYCASPPVAAAAAGEVHGGSPKFSFPVLSAAEHEADPAAATPRQTHQQHTNTQHTLPQHSFHEVDGLEGSPARFDLSPFNADDKTAAASAYQQQRHYSDGGVFEELEGAAAAAAAREVEEQQLAGTGTTLADCSATERQLPWDFASSGAQQQQQQLQQGRHQPHTAEELCFAGLAYEQESPAFSHQHEHHHAQQQQELWSPGLSPFGTTPKEAFNGPGLDHWRQEARCQQHMSPASNPDGTPLLPDSPCGVVDVEYGGCHKQDMWEQLKEAEDEQQHHKLQQQQQQQLFQLEGDDFHWMQGQQSQLDNEEEEAECLLQRRRHSWEQQLRQQDETHLRIQQQLQDAEHHDTLWQQQEHQSTDDQQLQQQFDRCGRLSVAAAAAKSRWGSLAHCLDDTDGPELTDLLLDGNNNGSSHQQQQEQRQQFCTAADREHSSRRLTLQGWDDAEAGIGATYNQLQQHPHLHHGHQQQQQSSSRRHHQQQHSLRHAAFSQDDLLEHRAEQKAAPGQADGILARHYTPPALSVPRLSPLPVLGSGGDCSGRGFLSRLQQLLHSPLDGGAGMTGDVQAATAEAAEAAAQESVGSGWMDKQMEGEAAGLSGWDRHCSSFSRRKQVHHHQQQQQQPPNRPTTLRPAESEETVQQQQQQQVLKVSRRHGQPKAAAASKRVAREAATPASTAGNSTRLQQRTQDQRQQKQPEHSQAVVQCEAPAAVPAPGPAPLLLPFQERLLRSASPLAKQRRRFAVSDALEAENKSAVHGQVTQQLQLEGPAVAAAAALAGNASGAEADAAAQAGPSQVADAGAVGHGGNVGSKGCNMQRLPGQQQATTAMSRLTAAPAGPDRAHMKESEEQQQQQQTAVGVPAVAPCKRALRDISNAAAVTGQAASGGAAAVPSATWKRVQQHWQQWEQHQQRSEPGQKRKKVSADKAHKQAHSDKQLQQSKLPFLFGHSLKPAAEAPSAAAPAAAASAQGRDGMQSSAEGAATHKSGAVAAIAGPKASTSVTAGCDTTGAKAAAAAAAGPAVRSTMHKARVPQCDDVNAPAGAAAAAGPGDSVVRATPPAAAAAAATPGQLRSSLSRPKLVRRPQQQPPSICNDGSTKPCKRVRFTGIPLSQGSSMAGNAEQQQQELQGRDSAETVSAEPAASLDAGVAIAEHGADTPEASTTAVTVHASAAAAAVRTAAGPMRSPFFKTVVQAGGGISTASIVARSAVVGGAGAGAGAGQFDGVGGQSGAPVPSILTLEELCSSNGGSSSRLMPGSVTRLQLQQAHTLAQADNKLVVVRCGSVLLAIDQHAADERVQLEALQQQLAAEQQQQRQQQEGQGQCLGSVAERAAAGPVRPEHQAGATGMSSSRGSTGGFRSSSKGAGRQISEEQLLLQQQLLPGVPMLLSMAETKALAQYRQHVESWGWKVLLQDNGAAAAGAAATDQVAGVTTPAVLQQAPVLYGVQLGALDMQMYLYQLLETAGSAQPPPGVVRVLKSKACRTAIMFGRPLSQQQCKKLVWQLGATQLCFCCAHGRPTTAPLIDLAALAARMRQQADARSLGQAAAVAAATTGKAASSARTVCQQHRAMLGLGDHLRQALAR